MEGVINIHGIYHGRCFMMADKEYADEMINRLRQDTYVMQPREKYKNFDIVVTYHYSDGAN